MEYPIASLTNGYAHQRRAALGERPSSPRRGNRGPDRRSEEAKLRRSVSSDHWPAPVEQVVDSQLHHLDIVIAGDRVAGEGRDQDSWHHEGPTGKPQKVILEFHRPIIGEGVLDACSQQPTAHGVAGVADEHLTGCQVGDGEAVVADPTAAGLAVKQRAIGRETKSSGERRDPRIIGYDLESVSPGADDRDAIAIIIPNPVEVRLGPDHVGAFLIVAHPIPHGLK